MDSSDRQKLVWGLVFSVPPGVGMLGFVAVSLEGGAVTPTGLAAGGVTTAAVLSLFLASIYVGDDESGDASEAGDGDRADEWDQAAGVDSDGSE